MNDLISLSITTPLEIVLSETGIASLRGEDASGGFGILPGHADFLTVIDVIKEGIDRANPLLDPPHQQRPFTGADDPWHQVERDQPLIRFGFAIDIECDARAPEHGLRIA